MTSGSEQKSLLRHINSYVFLPDMAAVTVVLERFISVPLMGQPRDISIRHMTENHWANVRAAAFTFSGASVQMGRRTLPETRSRPNAYLCCCTVREGREREFVSGKETVHGIKWIVRG